MSTNPVAKTPGVENYIKVYGSFPQADQKSACAIADEIIKKIFDKHLTEIKRLRDPDDAASCFLAYVSEALQDEELAEKLDACGQKLLGRSTPSEFATAIEWGTIDYLTERLKNREIEK